MSPQFQTKLENPTSYYVYKTQERQLKEYIKQHGTSSQAFTPPTSQATLNAINNMASLPHIADGLGITGAMKPPDSPMSAASSTEPSEVSIFAEQLYRLDHVRLLYNIPAYPQYSHSLRKTWKIVIIVVSACVIEIWQRARGGWTAITWFSRPMKSRYFDIVCAKLFCIKICIAL